MDSYRSQYTLLQQQLDAKDRELVDWMNKYKRLESQMIEYKNYNMQVSEYQTKLQQLATENKNL